MSALERHILRNLLKGTQAQTKIKRNITIQEKRNYV